jgi:hypothetical protein
VKSLKMCFAALVIFSLLAGCGQVVNQPPSAISATPATHPANTPRSTITPIPAPSRRPTDQPTATKIPATPGGPTLTPGGPTFTSLPTFTFTPNPTDRMLTLQASIKLALTGTPEPTANPLQCSIMTHYPNDGQAFTPRTDFVAQWKVGNSGSVMWRGLLIDPDNVWIPDGAPTPIPGKNDSRDSHGDILFNFWGGTKMNNKGQSNYFLPFTVYVGDHINFKVHIIAPKELGEYSAWWVLRRSNKKDPFCFLPLSIKVVPKVGAP